MPAYAFFNNREVRDADALAEYKAAAAAVVAQYGGTYRVIGGPAERREGDWAPAFPVIIEFPTMEAARAWYDSPEYRPLREQRIAAVESEAVLIAGL